MRPDLTVPLPEMQSEYDGRSSVRLLRTRARSPPRLRGDEGAGLAFAGMHTPLSLEHTLATGSDPARPRSRPRWLGLGVFLAALLPALTAIWATPWFIT